MADLFVIEYDNMYKAEEIRFTLQKMQRDYLVNMEDAVVAAPGSLGGPRKTPGAAGRQDAASRQ